MIVRSLSEAYPRLRVPQSCSSHATFLTLLLAVAKVQPQKEQDMKKLVFFLCLVLFLPLVACNQTPTTDLATQGVGYGQVRFGVVSDYLEGAKETNFNGQFDEGEFLIPNFEIRLTPISKDGKPIGEAIGYLTNGAQNSKEGAVLKVPVGWYLPEVVLPTDLQGGEEYAWKPFGPSVPPLPPILVKYQGLFDGIYSVACGFGGRMFIEIRGLDEYAKSPCHSEGIEPVDSLSVSPQNVSFPCGTSEVSTTVHISSKNPSPGNFLTLTVTGLPVGMSYQVSPFAPPASSTALTLSTNGVAPGTYTLTVQDSRGLNAPLTVNTNAKGNIVNIPDTNLQSQVRAALNIPAPTPICAEDMLALTSLGTYEVTNLEGLQYAKNLTLLRLERGFYGTVPNLTPLTGLTKLTDLDLSYTSMSINQISRVQSLKKLYLYGSGLRYSVAPSVPSSLETIELYRNSIDSKVFAYLPNLKVLIVGYDSHISLSSVVHHLTNLEHLELSLEYTSDFSFLPQLTSLKVFALFNIMGNRTLTFDAAILTNLSDLTEFSLNGWTGGGWDVQNFSTLATKVGLQRLRLDHTNITDMQPLSGLLNLKYLSLQNNPISDITPLVQNAGLARGDEIYLQNTLLSPNDRNDPDLANIKTLQNRKVTVSY
jgi:Leucine-rich repeat (LRR) protein